MIADRLLVIAALAVLSSLCFSPAARAWDGIATSTLAVHGSDFEPERITAPDANGFWAFGYATSGSGTTQSVFSALVRYDDATGAQGATRIADPSALSASAPAATGLFATPDGGALLSVVGGNRDFPGPGYSCYLERYDAAGALRWTRITYNSGSSVGLVLISCPSASVDASGGIWLAATDDNGPQRLGDDGSPVAEVDAVGASTVISDPHDGSVYVLGTGYLGNYAADGTLSWRNNSSAFTPPYAQMLVDNDGDIVVAGVSGNLLVAQSFGSDGPSRWSTSTPLPSIGLDYIADMASAPAGATYVSVVGGSTYSTAQVFAFRDDGTLAWPAPFVTQAGANCNGPFAASVSSAPNGDALFLYAAASYCDGTTTLTRLGTDGSVVYSRSLGGNGFPFAESRPVSLADGTTLLAGDGMFRRFSASGDALPAPPTAGIASIGAHVIDQALAADGDSYALGEDGVSRQQTLDRFGPDGALRWQHDVIGFEDGAQLLNTADRVCIAGERAVEVGIVVQCFLATDGAPLWSWSDPAGARFYGAHLLDDGRIVALFSDRHVLFAADGTVLHATEFRASDFSGVAFNGFGDALVAMAGLAPGYELVRADGLLAYSSAQLWGVVERAPLGMALADDGSAVVTMIGTVVPAGTVVVAARLDAAGSLLWKSTLAPYPSSDYSVGFGGAFVRLNGEKVTVAVPPRSQPGFVAALDFDSGDVSWITPVTQLHTELATPARSDFAAFLADTGATRLLLVGDAGGKLRLTVFDAATGTVIHEALESCSEQACLPQDAAIGTDGSLRVAAQAPHPPTGTQLHVYRKDAPFVAPASVRIDQPGLDGAWFAPYESGQGFTFDWIASANTIFMPWFTFAQSGANDPSGLAWYTLQGTVEPGATGADLVLALTDAGAFASGSVAGRIVGAAHLSFSDCTSGTLLYQFDDGTNGGAGGLITLTRLTPATDPCVLADGSTVPAQNANPPSAGFDARQSGSWYDPATGGQGLELTIVPPGNGSPGLVFAPWFTFDPAGIADDPLHQHWFTLQGDLSQAANGRVELPIYRIIGGSFDATPTANFAQVGHATLTLLGCDSARLDYQFDASDVAHAFAGLAGTMHLDRIGGCTH